MLNASTIVVAAVVVLVLVGAVYFSVKSLRTGGCCKGCEKCCKCKERR